MAVPRTVDWPGSIRVSSAHINAYSILYMCIYIVNQYVMLVMRPFFGLVLFFLVLFLFLSRCLGPPRSSLGFLNELKWCGNFSDSKSHRIVEKSIGVLFFFSFFFIHNYLLSTRLLGKQRAAWGWCAFLLLAMNSKNRICRHRKKTKNS